VHVVILDQWMMDVRAGCRGGASPAPCDALLLLAQPLWRKIRSIPDLVGTNSRYFFLIKKI